MSKEIPKIIVQDDVLTITITADDLKWVADHKPDCSYEVHDKSGFLKDFAGELEHTFSRSESGMTKLQELIDDIIDETYENGSEAITDRNDE